MKTIPLTRGRFALVDDEDFELLFRHKWSAEKASKSDDIWYAQTHLGRSVMRMHEMVMGKIKGTIIHHEDHNGLNNQKHNLKRTTHANNMGHSKKRKTNTSGYKGVSWDKFNSKWNVRVGVGPSRFVKRFSSLKDAVAAYDAEAVKRWGDFALTNKQLGLVVP
jgi:hypothetical protein